MNKSYLLLYFTITISLKTYAIERVISLTPHTTELAVSAGLGKQLIAVSEHSDYPTFVRTLPKVANYHGINLEKIIAMQPDLIIAWSINNSNKDLAKLKELGFNIYYSQIKTLDDITKNVLDLSKYSNDPTIGKNAVLHFTEQLQVLRQKYHTLKQADHKISYFYQLSPKPIITLAADHWPSSVFQFCGGTNVFANSPIPYPQVSIENIIAKNPESIFMSSFLQTHQEHNWLSWQEFLPAIQNKYLWYVNDDELNRPTLRVINAIADICDKFLLIQQNNH